MAAPDVRRDAGTLRSDARLNRQALVEAASAAFREAGLDATTRDIAARAGVGAGTLFRHFPTRADLVAAVYRQQVDDCAEAGLVLLAGPIDAAEALHRWVGLFVEFLATKHGLPAALQHGEVDADALHQYFVGRLVPVGDALLRAAVQHRDRGEPPVSAFALLRGIGNLCIGGARPMYDPRALAALLVEGALQSEAASRS